MIESAIEFISDRWEETPTGRIIQLISVSRSRFRQHPLYRRWSMAAYQNPAAIWAEEIPAQFAQFVPLTVLFGPFVLFFVAIIFGSSVFDVLLAGLLMAGLGLAVIIASFGAMMVAGLASGALAGERETGRWDMLMMIPVERANVLVMRISSMLHPYAPMVAMMDLLQTGAAMITALVLSSKAGAVNSDLVSACCLFLLPSLLLLTWERQQDYALSVAWGGYAGLVRHEQQALGLAFSGAAMMIALRVVVAMIAIGLSPNAHGFRIALPAFIAGPAMLPMMGVPLTVFVPLLLLYYSFRELVITRLWHHNQQILQG